MNKQRLIPLIVATALFMENMDSTVIATSLPAIAADIGTSPLYTLKECFSAHTHLTPTVANVNGILSLIFWSIIFVVTLKYISFVLRADNKGEGGILTLAALAGRKLSGLRSLLPGGLFISTF